VRNLLHRSRRRLSNITLLSVISLSRKRRGWTSVRCSEGGLWLLPDTVIRRLGLAVDESVEASLLDSSAMKEQPGPARTDAIRFLSHSERTAAQLRLYLGRRGYHPGVIRELTDWAIENAFVNDARYAEIFVRSRTRGALMGRSRIRSELMKKGVSQEEAESAVRDRLDSDLYDDLVGAVRKKYGALEHETAFRRASGWLSRRGFRTDLALRVLHEALSAEEEPAE